MYTGAYILSKMQCVEKKKKKKDVVTSFHPFGVFDCVDRLNQ